MKRTQYGRNLIQLTRLLAFNCHLVREDDGFTLVDTGMSGSADGILAAADAFGAPIRRIALTHAHIDHVGSLDALAARLPGIEIAMSARDARFMAGDLSLDGDEAQTPLRGGFPRCSTVPTRFLHEGDRVGSLEVIATPGHTPGHLSFLDTRDGTLLAGDAYSTRAGVSTAGSFRLLFPFPAMATWNRPAGVSSARKLLALRPARLAVGHGAVLEHPLAAMQAAIDEAQHAIPEAAYAR